MISIAADLAPLPGVSRLLDRLDAEQRAAALLPHGPALVIAPAGSGKTTTLVARLGVLLARGVPAARIAVATFNRDAALQLSARIQARLTPLIREASQIEVRTYQAMLAARGMVDFDDLVVDAASRLESDPALRLRWQRRFTHLCVDEFQDVDAAQLRLVRLLAEPERNLFVVGDDDQP